MEEVLPCSRRNLRDHFEAFLHGRKVNYEEVEKGESFNRADLRGSLSGEEVRIKTESSTFEEALPTYCFFKVPIKTEKPDDEIPTRFEAHGNSLSNGGIGGNPVFIKTEKLDIDEIVVSCQPSTSALLILDVSNVKKEKEDIVCIKTEKEENHIRCEVVKTEKTVQNNDVTSQQLLTGCRIKEEAGYSSQGCDTDRGNFDVADSSIHSPNPPDRSDFKLNALLGGTNQLKKQGHSENSVDTECTHNRLRERKAKNLAKMMLKELEENLDFVDAIDGKHAGSFQASKSFTPHPMHSSVPRRLQDLNIEFNKYKGIFSLQECSVKVRRLPEEVLIRYGVKLEMKIDLETLKKGLFPFTQCDFRADHVHILRRHVRWS